MKKLKTFSDITDKRLLGQAKSIMDNIDFGKIHSVMNFLNWKWAKDDDVTKLEIPSLSALIKQAESLLADVAAVYEQNKEYCYVATGGFIASITEYGDLSLVFSIEDWEENIEDYDENGKLKEQ